MHLNLAIDRFKCASACLWWLWFIIAAQWGRPLYFAAVVSI